MDGCGLCGGQLDDHRVKVTLTFAAGLRNGNHFLEVPHQLKDWTLCWKCFEGTEQCGALRRALADEYIEPVVPKAEACKTVCAGHLRRKRRIFRLHQGSRGLPEEHARCPVCFGPCEVERAA
jgi:hypothetical protein